MMHYRGGRAAIDASACPDLASFWRDLSAVYAAEITELAKLGCTYLKLHDTSFFAANARERASASAPASARSRGAAS